MSETAINNESDTTPDRAGMKWDHGEDNSLYDAFTDDFDLNETARRHRRKPGGIRSRLRRLGLIDGNNIKIVPKPPFIPKTANREGHEYPKDRDDESLLPLSSKERAGIKLFRKIYERQHRTILNILQAFAAANNGIK